ALSAQQPDARILELGTYDGEFTAILSRLFPKGSIVTVDLPDDDPIMRQTYGRDDAGRLAEFKRTQKQNVDAPNVQTVSSNTAFLLDRVPSPTRHSFDFVWVDGGHLYPDVAWDMAYAFHLCRPGGVVAVDDVVFTNAAARDGYTSTDTGGAL